MTDTSLIRKICESLLSGIHTALPGVITAYDHDSRTISVQPGMKKKFTDGTVLDMPVIDGVPLIIPSLSSRGIHIPVKKGDNVLLVFSERCIDSFMPKGEVLTPQDPRKFDLSDAIAIPGLSVDSESQDVSNDTLTVYNGSAKIELFTNGDVSINDGNLLVKA